MRKSLVLSSVALSALLLATAPAGALSINIGGDGGLVSVDSGSSSSSSSSGDSGGSTTEGTDGGLLKLGGKKPLIDLSGDAEVDATVNVDLGVGDDGNDRLIDLDTGGDNGVIVDLFGDEGAIADVELGLDGDDGALGGNGLVDLDTGSEDGVIIDLFGKSGAVADVELGLDRDDGVVHGNGLLDFGTGGDNGVIVDLFGEGSAVADVELGLDGSNGSLVDNAGGSYGTGEVVDIDGDGGAPVNARLLRSAPGSGSAGTASLDLFGAEPADDGGGADNVDETTTGSVTAADDGTTDGTDDGTDTDETAMAAAQPAGAPAPGAATARPAAGGAVGGAASTRVASTGSGGGAGACFSPDQAQIAHLLARNSYTAEITAELRTAEKIRLVPINLCEDARARIEAALAADPNIGTLQATVASDAEMSAALEPGYEPGDVLAADPAGEEATMYVY